MGERVRRKTNMKSIPRNPRALPPPLKPGRGGIALAWPFPGLEGMESNSYAGKSFLLPPWAFFKGWTRGLVPGDRLRRGVCQATSPLVRNEAHLSLPFHSFPRELGRGFGRKGAPVSACFHRFPY